jgi:hypothetical protein
VLVVRCELPGVRYELPVACYELPRPVVRCELLAVRSELLVVHRELLTQERGSAKATGGAPDSRPWLRRRTEVGVAGFEPVVAAKHGEIRSTVQLHAPQIDVSCGCC